MTMTVWGLGVEGLECSGLGLGFKVMGLGIGFIQGLDDEDDDREDVWRRW